MPLPRRGEGGGGGGGGGGGDGWTQRSYNYRAYYGRANCIVITISEYHGNRRRSRCRGGDNRYGNNRGN